MYIQYTNELRYTYLMKQNYWIKTKIMNYTIKWDYYNILLLLFSNEIIQINYQFF